MPIPAELRAEIESGPLAAALAAPWAGVFPAEDEPDPKDAPAHERWERIRQRFGALTPDAVHDLLAVLNDPAKRSKPFPIAVATFTNFLAGRGLLRKIKAAVTEPAVPDPVKDVCDLIVTATLAAPDRQIDPTDPQTQGMIGAIVAAGIAKSDDAAALTKLCTKPCSRLAELGWSVTAADLQAAKVVA